jgi:membrane protein
MNADGPLKPKTSEGMKLKELALRTWSESREDDVFGSAATLAYFFLLALFPLLIFLTSAIGFLPGVQDSILDALARVAPPDAMTLVRDTLTDVVSHRSGGLLSLGLMASLWSASSGVASLMDALNIAYDIDETRPFWRRRLKAISLTLAMTVLVAGGSILIMIGHRLDEWVKSLLQVSSIVALASTILGYLTGVGLLLLGIEALYYFGPDIQQERRPVKPGALFATAGVVIGSILFSFYVRLGPSASATYGSLGAVVTLMLWFYLLGLVLLIGGEINSELGKPAGGQA